MDVVDVAERLMAEYERRFPLPLITRTVLGSVRDLGAGAEPATVEKLVRERLDALAGLPPVPAPRRHDAAHGHPACR